MQGLQDNHHVLHAVEGFATAFGTSEISRLLAKVFHYTVILIANLIQF